MLVRVFRSIPVLAIVATLACSPPPVEQATQVTPEPPPIDQTAVTQMVADITAALAAGDIARVGTGYAEDAVLVNARGRTDTRAGIEAFWAGALKAAGTGKDLKLEVVKWGASGDLAYSLSRFTGGITAGSGYVLGVVERQADGSLKTVAQVSIPDPPAK
jgi:ketosteroid isomerase-like protein